jgi:hypothetical protein
MRKLLFLLLVCTSIPYLFYGQNFNFGFAIEPSATWMNTDDPEVIGDGGNLGFKFAVIGENFFDDNFGATAGIRLGFGLGGALKHDFGGRLLPDSELTREIRTLRDSFPNNTSIGYSMGMLEIPVSFKMRSNQAGYLRYFAEFPIISFGVVTKAEGDITSSTINAEDENIIKDVRSLFVNWGVGGGIEYEVNNDTYLVAGLYYMSSLSDMTTDDARKTVELSSGEVLTESEDSKGILRQISLRVGILF